ncbi:hypothetical protein M1555_05255 [Patescibacteria group bacterium]|nr:hypothetical protein [Patescibacteria group bacterium]
MNILFFVGQSGAGKSAAVSHIEFLAEVQGMRAYIWNDKIAFDEEVVADVEVGDGVSHGLHAEIIGGEEIGSLQVHPLDGETINRAHDRILRELVEFQKNEGSGDACILVEWAYGEDMDYGPEAPAAHQSPFWLLHGLRAHGLLEDSWVLDIRSPVDTRFARNDARPHAISRADFMDWFGDSAGFRERERAELGERYCPIDNHLISEHEFLRQVRLFAGYALGKSFEGNQLAPEGGSLPIER